MSTTHHSCVQHLSMQFAKFFNDKDVDGIATLLTDECALYDPALKWIKGKENVIEVMQKQLQEAANVSYEIIHIYEDGDTAILEFKITLDQLILYGVDVMHWEQGKIRELRCYYHPPPPPQHEELKPFSLKAKSLREGEIYEHYRGKRYKILSVGRNSETLEESVVYQALYGDHDVWIRPLNMFLENIVIDGQVQPRFKRVQ